MDIITVDKDKCVNCHKCIAVCPVKYCNNGAGEYVTVDNNLCIHCGRCVEACPLGLNPTAFAHAMEREDDEERAAILTKEQVSLCMECGSCTFVCPAHRPLAESNHAAKGFIRSYNNARKEGGK